jgi:hypothetical protein
MMRAEYAEIADRVRPGDVIAFAGKDGVSEWIKTVTKGPVSHVAVVLDERGDDSLDTSPPFIIEAPGEPFVPVVVRSLPERLSSYAGSVWWLPLSDDARSRLDTETFGSALRERVGTAFDIGQAVQAGADRFDDEPGLGALTRAREDFAWLFCSELVTLGYEAGGMISSLNCSEVTPMDLCRFAIYSDEYYQLKGRETEIPGHNGLDPEGWGE